jgi:hypothetical protein
MGVEKLLQNLLPESDQKPLTAGVDPGLKDRVSVRAHSHDTTSIRNSRP